ncbi:hypothetical protein F183_A03770 [Bryobacterales bacterium F-183]|nr:hypothetical protein F183_A03770 [Bryobacterales bacterium F-183]
MNKKIVLLSDGTGNSAAKLFKSNVWRTYQALDLSQGDQIACYNDGVGNSSFKPLAILGGAFGWGLKRNVLELYTFLCRNYKPGDQIYCFGFSRGAFTIRILAGLIDYQGIVTADSEPELRQKAAAAFRALYRERFVTVSRIIKVGRWIRDLFTGNDGAAAQARSQNRKGDIQFVGLFDTVAAYGLPIEELTRAWSWFFPLSIPDRDPLPRVNLYCHALGLDDERNTFHPVLLNEPDTARPNVKQLWFAGMHSNVGGGYPDDGMSYVPLQWMLAEASAQGLRFKPQAVADVQQLADPIGRLYDSRRGVGGFYRYQPRRMDLLLCDTSEANNEVRIARPKIHDSVLHRIRKGVDHYAPIVLPREFDVVNTAGAVVAHPETSEQSEQRSRLQERIWDLVWWKRVAYFLSIGVSLALLAFPLYLPATEACATSSCVVSPVIRWAALFLPGFASPWARAFESHPACFFGFVFLFLALLKAGDHYQRRIQASMRQLWGHVIEPGAKVRSALKEPGGFPYWFRTNSLYQAAFRISKRFVLPVLAASVVIFAAVQLLLRLLFLAGSSGGFVCPAEWPAPQSPLMFDISKICTASGIEAKRGKTYIVEMQIDTPWTDGGYLKANVQGLSDPPKWMSLFALTRRSARQTWLKPVLRIGDKGMDEYRLDGVVTGNGTRLVAEVRARRDGQMYFYVNDAVLPVPADYQYFYGNNKGTAVVTIREKIAP